MQQSANGHGDGRDTLGELGDSDKESEGEARRPRVRTVLGATAPPGGRRGLSVQDLLQGGFDISNTTAMQAYIETRRIRPGTRGEYDRTWRTWELFWQVCGKGGLPGNVELAGLTTEESTDAWVRFIWFLRVAAGVNPDKIGTYLSATRKQLKRRRIPTEFTNEDNVFIMDARTAVEQRSREELREQMEKRERSLRLPMFDELLVWLYDECWRKTAWDDRKGIELKAVALGSHIADVLGFRESNLVRPRKDRTDHALLAQDIKFVVLKSDGSVMSARGGSEEAKGLSVEDGCQEACVDVLSAKPRNFPGARQSVRSIDERGRRVIQMLCDWYTYSGVLPDDYRLTFRHRSSTNQRGYTCVLTSSAFNNGLKAAAVGVGVPAEHVSSRSFRSGVATRGGLTGQSTEQIMQQGLWKSAEVVTRHYNKAGQIYRPNGDHRPTTKEEALTLLPPEKRARGQKTVPGRRTSSSAQGAVGGAAV